MLKKARYKKKLSCDEQKKLVGRRRRRAKQKQEAAERLRNSIATAHYNRNRSREPLITVHLYGLNVGGENNPNDGLKGHFKYISQDSESESVSECGLILNYTSPEKFRSNDQPYLVFLAKQIEGFTSGGKMLNDFKTKLELLIKMPELKAIVLDCYKQFWDVMSKPPRGSELAGYIDLSKAPAPSLGLGKKIGKFWRNADDSMSMEIDSL